MDKFRIVDTLNESFALNERKKENKILKDAHIKATGVRGNAPKGVYSDQEAYADNPHGSEGSMRGVRRIPGEMPSEEQQRINTRREINRRKRFIAANKAATKELRANLEGVAPKKKSQKKEEKPMTNENFEAAFVRANAQIAFTIAEAMTKITAKPAEGHSTQHSTRGQSGQSGEERDSKGRRLFRGRDAKGHDSRYSTKSSS
jgi:hypothetical protein